MKNFISLIVFIALCVVSFCCHSAESPEQVVGDYYAALQQKGIRAMPSFIHPTDLERSKVALYMAMERDQNLKGESLKDATFGKNTSLEETRSLPADQFMTKFFSSIPADMSLNGTLTSYEILGSVNEKENVHVVVRLNFPSYLPETTKLHVLTMKPYLGTWKVGLPAEFERLIAQINNAIDKKASK